MKQMKKKMKHVLLLIILVTLLSAQFCRGDDPLDTWSKRDSGTLANLSCVTYGHGTFVAVGDTGTILSSTDGISWSNCISGTQQPLTGIVYGSNIFVAVGNNITLTSADGLNWINQAANSYALRGIAYGNTLFTTIAPATSGLQAWVGTSTNGVVWSWHNFPGNGNHIQGITFANSNFVTAVWNGNCTCEPPCSCPIKGYVYYSTNGSMWGASSVPSGTYLYAIDCDQGLLMVVGALGKVLTASSFSTWTNNLPGPTNSLLGVGHGNSTFVVVGSEGIILSLPDGGSWSWRISGTTNDLKSVAYNNGYFVAVGNNGTILQSDNVAFEPPSIVTQPQNCTVQVTNSVTFNVMASGALPLNYQWLFNGRNIVGQTATNIFLNNVQFTNAGGYSVIVTNAYGFVTSAVAQLTVFTNLVFTQTNRAPTTNEIGKPTIPTNSNYFKVFTNGNFMSGVGLNPNKNTVVLTHGWNGSPSDWAAYTAQIIQQRIGINTVNIVAWDWSEDAQSPWYDLGKIAAKTPGEGFALGTNLVAALGANYSQRIHFVGHSLGTLVNAAAANYLETNGYSWTNIQVTLCDEAEVAWEFTSVGWQMATTLPEIIQQGKSTLATLAGNFSTPQPYWDHPLPAKFAWADNYISAFGLLHSDAANIILTYTYPQSFPDVNTIVQEFYNFHDYAHFFYEDTIEPGIFNTGGQINATYAGFICSFEGGDFAGRPATNTYFYQDPSGLELNLTQKDLAFATNFLNGRVANYLSIGISSVRWQANDSDFNVIGQVLGQVNGQIESAGQNLGNMVLNFFTGIASGSLVQNTVAHPLGRSAPNGTGTGNTPAYAWIPLNVPANAVSMSFDFILQGSGNNDSFQVALNGTNVLSLETSLIQTNVTMNSGLIDVSQYAGQQVILYMGIVGGTSTNAALTVNDFQFYVTLLPWLQIQLSGTNVVLSWPLSAAGYVLQTTDKLTMTNTWTTVTNVPEIVNFEYMITNQISGDSRFYRLALNSAPTLQAQVSGSSFVLSWPASAQNFSLQTTTNLTDPNSWMTVTDTPAIMNLQCLITNQISGAARFYRLKK